jgi:hypothetical protein
LDAVLALAAEGRPGSFVHAVVAFEDLSNTAAFDPPPPDGTPDGRPDGTPDGRPDGTPGGTPDGTPDGSGGGGAPLVGSWAIAQAAARAEAACVGVNCSA